MEVVIAAEGVRVGSGVGSRDLVDSPVIGFELACSGIVVGQRREVIT